MAYDSLVAGDSLRGVFKNGQEILLETGQGKVDLRGQIEGELSGGGGGRVSTGIAFAFFVNRKTLPRAEEGPASRGSLWP